MRLPLGGWQVAGNFAFISGLPLNVTSAATSLNMPNDNQRANLVKSQVQILGTTGSGQSYFDPLAFAPVTTASFGTAGYEILKGPSTATIDLGLTRRFKTTERTILEFRAEAFNATNTPHWANPDHVAQRRRQHPEPGRFFHDHQHAGEWSRKYRRTHRALRSEMVVLI
jgi:hypothetical protein